MKIVNLIVTFFYIGNLAKAPGTFASLFVVIVFFIFSKFLSIPVFFLIIILTIGLAFCSIPIYTKNFKDKDKSEIVIDEVIGQSIALIPTLIFVGSNSQQFYSCLLSFLFFRFFDILKPFPINIFDKMNNAFGVIFDDFLAGLFSALLITFLLFSYGN